MNRSDNIQLLITSFSLYLPTLLVSLFACVMTITKWKQAPGAARWSLLGFGLALLLCLTTPVGHWLLQLWVLDGSGTGSRIWAFTAFGFVNAILHAAVYVLLLVAVFSDRR
jgi:hypothetical protein